MRKNDCCQCQTPDDVFNGVCGVCLMPLDGIIHNKGGEVIEDKRKIPSLTNGSWRVKNNIDSDGSFINFEIINNKDKKICDIEIINDLVGSEVDPEEKQYANIISSAPDLYEMVLIIKEQADRGEIKLDKITYGSIVQVLKKATGG